MSVPKSKDKLHEHRTVAIEKLDNYLSSLIESDESKLKGKADNNRANLLARVESATSETELLNRMRSEISRMNRGSIALVNQITTISKIRIYDPKTDHDILSNIKLSNRKEILLKIL